MTKITDINEITRHLEDDSYSYLNQCIAIFERHKSELYFTHEAVRAIAERVSTMRIKDIDECAKRIVLKILRGPIQLMLNKDKAFNICVRVNESHIRLNCCPTIMPLYRNEDFLSKEDYEI